MLLNPYLCLCGDKELLLIIFSLFLSPVAASGNTVIVQLLCEHKCHVNLKDSVCMSLIRDSLTAGKMVFLSFSACVLLHLRAACGLPQTCALSGTTPQRLCSLWVWIRAQLHWLKSPWHTWGHRYWEIACLGLFFYFFFCNEFSFIPSRVLQCFF